MDATAKISPAFEPFLAESGPNDKRDAIVIYRAPEEDPPAPSPRAGSSKRRRNHLQERSEVQRTVQDRLLEDYLATGEKMLRGKRALSASSIGRSALPVASVEITRRTLQVLAEQPDVVAILPNQKVRLITPTEVDYSELASQEAKDGLTWGLKQLDVQELWNVTQGENVNVAVLDTGVYAEHPALEGRVADFVVIDPLGRRITANPSFDRGRHGTHVCGTIAGSQATGGMCIGVAPKANLLVAGVLVGDATLRTVLEGISWAVEMGADIVNMSLGFSYYEPLFDEVFRILIDQYAILPVVAIGNENYGNCSSPGNSPHALSVGAVEKLPRGKTKVAFFSGGASLVLPGKRPHKYVTKPDVVAPGVQVYSSIPPEQRPDGEYEYAYMDGTSMATPHVAGIAALLMAARPEATVSQIVNAIKETARHPEGKHARPDNRWGYGLVQPIRALAALSADEQV